MFFSKPDKNIDHIEYEGIVFEVVKRKVRYFRVEFKSKVPKIILPYGTNPEKILAENFHRIRKKYDQFIDHMENAGRMIFLRGRKKNSKIWSIFLSEDIP